MKLIVRLIPSLLVTLGALWLGFLTFTNMMFCYYGWVPSVRIENRKPSWTEEEVIQAFVTFGTEARDHVTVQAAPVILVLVGGIYCVFQTFKSQKQKKTQMATPRKSSD